MSKGIFLNGLKEEIQAELKLDELMDCALLIEEKNQVLRRVGLLSLEKKNAGITTNETK